MIDKRIVCAAALLMTLCLVGCVSKPTYKSTSFDPQKIDRIVVLPFIDNRAKPNPEHDFEDMCNCASTNLVSSLEAKGYRVLQSGDVGAIARYSAQDLPKKNPASKSLNSVDPNAVDRAWIKQLGPSSDRWVLVPVFEDLSTQFLLIGFTADAKFSIYLFDKERGELALKHVGDGMAKVGVLSAPIYNAVSGRKGLQKTAVGGAAITCTSCFPKHQRDKAAD